MQASNGANNFFNSFIHFLWCYIDIHSLNSNLNIKLKHYCLHVLTICSSVTYTLFLQKIWIKEANGKYKIMFLLERQQKKTCTVFTVIVNRFRVLNE
jgi:hypothetical protein